MVWGSTVGRHLRSWLNHSFVAIVTWLPSSYVPPRNRTKSSSHNPTLADWIVRGAIETFLLTFYLDTKLYIWGTTILHFALCGMLQCNFRPHAAGTYSSAYRYVQYSPMRKVVSYSTIEPKTVLSTAARGKLQ